MIPTIEEVRQHFKNAYIVENCLGDRVILNLEERIVKTKKGSYYICKQKRNNEMTTIIVLWSKNSGYATIISEKALYYQLSPKDRSNTKKDAIFLICLMISLMTLTFGILFQDALLRGVAVGVAVSQIIFYNIADE